MNLNIGAPYDMDNRQLATVTIEERFTEWDEDPEKETVKYDRRWFFPITAWLQDHRGDRINHRLYKEFCHLRTDVKRSYLINGGDEDREDTRMSISDALLRPCSRTILHLWDVQGCLQPWLVQRMCEFLVSQSSPDALPEPDLDARKREREFRNGPSSVEMVAGNIDACIFGVDKPFDEDEISEAQESGQGFPDYEFDLSRYKELYPE